MIDYHNRRSRLRRLRNAEFAFGYRFAKATAKNLHQDIGFTPQRRQKIKRRNKTLKNALLGSAILSGTIALGGGIGKYGKLDRAANGLYGLKAYRAYRRIRTV